MSKQDLREYFKAKLQSRAQAGRASSEFAMVQSQSLAQLHQRLADLIARHQGTWGAYKALSDEVELPADFESKGFAYPKVVGDELQYYAGSDFEKGSFGINEPKTNSGRSVPLHKLTGVLVPGLAFDRKGYRLGRGKGYYDRALKNFKGIKVGICWQDQVVETLPSEATDIPMNCIVTEKEFMEIKWK